MNNMGVFCDLGFYYLISFDFSEVYMLDNIGCFRWITGGEECGITVTGS